MKLSYTTLKKRPAVLQRLTGLSVQEFETLLETFSAQYEQMVIQPRVTAPGRVRAAGAGQKGALPEVADKLLFILVYTRIYPLLFIQGMFFGIAESKACTWVKVLLPVLDAALGRMWLRPKRATSCSLEEIIKEYPEREANWGYEPPARSGPSDVRKTRRSKKPRIRGKRSVIPRSTSRLPIPRRNVSWR